MSRGRNWAGSGEDQPWHPLGAPPDDELPPEVSDVPVVGRPEVVGSVLVLDSGPSSLPLLGEPEVPEPPPPEEGFCEGPDAPVDVVGPPVDVVELAGSDRPSSHPTSARLHRPTRSRRLTPGNPSSSADPLKIQTTPLGGHERNEPARGPDPPDIEVSAYGKHTAGGVL